MYFHDLIAALRTHHDHNDHVRNKYVRSVNGVIACSVVADATEVCNFPRMSSMYGLAWAFFVEGDCRRSMGAGSSIALIKVDKVTRSRLRAYRSNHFSRRLPASFVFLFSSLFHC